MAVAGYPRGVLDSAQSSPGHPIHQRAAVAVLVVRLRQDRSQAVRRDAVLQGETFVDITSPVIPPAVKDSSSIECRASHVKAWMWIILKQSIWKFKTNSRCDHLRLISWILKIQAIGICEVTVDCTNHLIKSNLSSGRPKRDGMNLNRTGNHCLFKNRSSVFLNHVGKAQQ